MVVGAAHLLVRSLRPIVGKSKLNLFLSFPFLVQDLDYNLTLDAIGYLRSYSHLGIGGRDAAIMATMERLGFNRIMTHGEAFKRVKWLEVLDPVPRND